MQVGGIPVEATHNIGIAELLDHRVVVRLVRRRYWRRVPADDIVFAEDILV